MPVTPVTPVNIGKVGPVGPTPNGFNVVVTCAIVLSLKYTIILFVPEIDVPHNSI